MAATTEAPRKQRGAEPKGAASSGLDTMLTDATRGPLRRLLPGRAAVKLAAKLTVRPDTVVTRGAQLAAELAKVGIGRSDARARQGRPALQGRRVARQPRLQAAAAVLPRHRARRSTG